MIEKSNSALKHVADFLLNTVNKIEGLKKSVICARQRESSISNKPQEISLRNNFNSFYFNFFIDYLIFVAAVTWKIEIDHVAVVVVVVVLLLVPVDVVELMILIVVIDFE